MKLTYEMAEKIFDMKKAGKSIKEISEELGVSDQTVRNRLKSEKPAEAEAVPEEKKAEETEKAEWHTVELPELIAVVECTEYIGRIGRYIVDDGDVSIQIGYEELSDEFPAEKLPEFIKELTALAKRLGISV